MKSVLTRFYNFFPNIYYTYEFSQLPMPATEDTALQFIINQHHANRRPESGDGDYSRHDCWNEKA